MMGVVVLCAAALCLPVPVPAQPLSCTEDLQCSLGYYCEMDTHICRECLSCQDLKREPPPLPFNTCIKSVAECGSCKEGLVVDRHSDVNAQCVPPERQLEPTPYYVWLLIGIGVLMFLALVVGIIAYLLRNPEIFKTADSNPSSTVTARITAASAPEAPPPYNPLPQPQYDSLPFTNPDKSYDEDEHFIKRSPASNPQDTRESAGNQAAIVYNLPNYERESQPPSPEVSVPEYNEAMTLPVHDEDTMPSPWMPSGPDSNGDVIVNGASDNDDNPAGVGIALPALLAAARDTTLVEHPAAKKRCVRQDSNNRNRDSNPCGDSNRSNFPRSPSPSQGGSPYSFITQITNVVQINTNK